MNYRKNQLAGADRVVDEGDLEKQIRQLKHENRQLVAQLAKAQKQVREATRCSKNTCQLREALDQVAAANRERTMQQRRLYAAANMQSAGDE